MTLLDFRCCTSDLNPPCFNAKKCGLLQIKAISFMKEKSFIILLFFLMLPGGVQASTYILVGATFQTKSGSYSSLQGVTGSFTVPNSLPGNYNGSIPSCQTTPSNAYCIQAYSFTDGVNVWSEANSKMLGPDGGFSVATLSNGFIRWANVEINQINISQNSFPKLKLYVDNWYNQFEAAIYSCNAVSNGECTNEGSRTSDYGSSYFGGGGNTANGVHFMIQLPPSITSGTYDASTGVLVVTGAGMTAGDSIDPTKLTLTGQGGSSYTLTSSAVTASSSTSFSITLNSTDKVNVNGLLNKNGTSADGGTTYNLAAATSWDATAGAPADLTGNGVTVSNVQSPTINSATYDASTGVLAVNSANLVSQPGSANDISVNKLTLTGEGGVTYSLTSSDVDITSSTYFSVVLNPTDKASINTMLNKNGTSSTGGTTYNLAAASP
ncbi:MAG: hypothetical protein K9K68_09405 [Methylococcaceae bacterium]|nr:hypothetical protein [Methylococcaceae bacterium]